MDRKNKNVLQHCIKIMRKFIPQSKVSACLFASDFPSENPRTQNRTILIRNRCV